MDRTPLPAEHDTRPLNAAEIMMMLRDQVGLPLGDIIDLDLQAIHDLLAANVYPADAGDAERIVVVDDDTLETLDRVVTGAIAKARPDRRMEKGYDSWTSRTRAMAKLGPVHAGKPLPALDAAIRATCGGDEVVLEDENYRQIVAALNATISSRPHGRSPHLDGAEHHAGARSDRAARARAFTAAHRGRVHRPELDGHHADGLDREVAGRFTVATLVAMTKEFAPEVRANPRSASFTYAPLGEETELTDIAAAYGKDIVCLGFEPGREREGPTNFAVFEKRNGRLAAWAECDPWSPPDEPDVVLRARSGDFCFAYDGERIVLYYGRPEGDDVGPGIAKARAMLTCIAAGSHDGSPAPTRDAGRAVADHPIHRSRRAKRRQAGRRVRPGVGRAD